MKTNDSVNQTDKESIPFNFPQSFWSMKARGVVALFISIINAGDERLRASISV